MYSEKKFLFYDLETSGLNKSFDQIQQCAIKIVDTDWQEKESIFFEAKLSPDTIPSAYATITHRISLIGDDVREAEIEVIKKIHKIFNTPGSISLGYNTLGFDDEFLRFSFYRNLLAPYTHQYASGCGRMDVFPIAVFYFLYAQDTIAWPYKDQLISLKLENIAEVNAWNAGRAHHAMHDVDATIALAKALQNGNPRMWDYLSGFFQKQEDKARIEKLQKIFTDKYESHIGLLISAKLGIKHYFQAPVLSLGWHRSYKNQIIWLRLDKLIFKDGMDYQFLLESGCIVRKKLAEPPFLLPWTEHYGSHLQEDRNELSQKNIKWIKGQPEFYEIIANNAVTELYAAIDNVDVDAALYEKGFRPQKQEHECQRLHALPYKEWSCFIEKMQDKSLGEQALRCLWRYNQGLLSQSQQDIMQTYQANLYEGLENKQDHIGRVRRNLQSLKDEIKEVVKGELDTEQQKLIQELSSWLVKQEKAKSVEQ
ncbi:MAG: exonuclease domain-containing protein [Pseudomonadota bacterium]|nr:exonuclease domain-containing protein [Pseudomonadota bacterium]